MKYPETGLPGYLQHDLDAFKEGLESGSSLMDCLWGELYGSINIALIDDKAISPEHADYLRKKYLFPSQYEMRREDLRVDPDIQVDDSGTEIEDLLETWSDARRKYGVELAAEDACCTAGARFDPFADKLVMAYEVSTDTNSEVHTYTPTENEAALIKAMIAEKIQELYDQTPQEFCREAQQGDNIKMEEHT